MQMAIAKMQLLILA